MKWSYELKLYFVLLGVMLSARPPDTLYIAWPCTVPPSVATLFPNGEKLFTLPEGRVILRYWGEPQTWPSSENPQVTAILPAFPDTGYPKPDFTIPELPSNEQAESLTPILWLALLGLLLGLVLFHRPLSVILKRAIGYLYWRLRWEVFLLRHSPSHQLSLPGYAKAIFQLLHPYCDFHPASLLPTETFLLSGPEPLRLLLQALLPPLYQECFLQTPLSEPERQNLYKQLYTFLKRARPYTGAPSRYRLCLSLSS